MSKFSSKDCCYWFDLALMLHFNNVPMFVPSSSSTQQFQDKETAALIWHRFFYAFAG
jgi:hypothetical protein